MTFSYIAALAGLFATAFVIGFSGAMMPGPLLTLTISESAKRGAWAGPILIVGHMLLELALVLLILFGLAPLLSDQAVISSIGIIGGLVMAWMGIGMLRRCRSLSLTEVRAGKATGMHPVIAGAVMSVANPYWTLWWATIGLTYVLAGLTFGAPGLIVFFVGHVSSDFVWYTIVSVAVAHGSRAMSDRVYRSVIGLCGVAIILFGVFFASSGVGYFAAV